MDKQTGKVKEMYDELIEFLETCKREDTIQENLGEINRRWIALGNVMSKEQWKPLVCKVKRQEPIVSKDVFEQAQRIQTDRKIVLTICRWLDITIRSYYEELKIPIILLGVYDLNKKDGKITFDSDDDKLNFKKVLFCVLEELTVKLKLCQIENQNPDDKMIENYLMMDISDAKDAMKKLGIQVDERIRDTQSVSVDKNGENIGWTICIGDTFERFLSSTTFTGMIQ